MRRLALAILLFMLALSLPHFAQAGKEGSKSVKKRASSGKTKAKAGKSVKSAKGKKSASTKIKKAEPETAVPAADNKLHKPAEVTDLHHWSTPDYTRIAVTLDHEAKFEKHEIAMSPGSSALSRIYFDISGARLPGGSKDIPIGDGVLKAARVAQYSSDTVRVVLDIENIRDYKIFTFEDPFRIIIDVKGERPAQISSITPEIKAAPAVRAPEELKLRGAEEKALVDESSKDQPVVKRRAKPVVKPGKVRRIVVDPGHGGKDPGAVGPNGLQEKDVVLDMGLTLAKRLKEELGVDVVMTRSTDVFIELQERTAIANQVGADLFVSMHANASLNRNASGIETYYLNLAKTEKAAQLAARENGTSLEKVSLLQAVLFDLMANYKLKDSAHMAEEVQNALYKRISGQYIHVKNLGVKQGPFYVLVGATMPSILVESAFISNDREEERLDNQSFRDQVAEGVYEGIAAYISSLQ